MRIDADPFLRRASALLLRLPGRPSPALRCDRLRDRRDHHPRPSPPRHGQSVVRATSRARSSRGLRSRARSRCSSSPRPAWIAPRPAGETSTALCRGRRERSRNRRLLVCLGRLDRAGNYRVEGRAGTRQARARSGGQLLPLWRAVSPISKEVGNVTPASRQALSIFCSLVLLLLGSQAAVTGRTAARPEVRPQKRWSDARLKQTLIDFGQDEIGPSTLRKLGEPAILSRVERLLRVTRTNNALHYYSAFTLAYFGRNYRRNVRVLTYPVELLPRDSDKYHDRYVASSPVLFDPADHAPDLLVRLYARNRDPALLRSLFSFALDGGPAEGLFELRRDLMSDYPLNVLDVLRRSRDLTDEALWTLLAMPPGDSELPESKVVTHKIRQSLRHAKPAVRRYGRWFLREYDRRLRIRVRPPK